jgi:hypothetical protein
VTTSAAAHRTPGAELATLLRLLAPADGSAGSGPLAALPWAPAGGGAPALLRQVARRVQVSTAARLSAAVARRRLTVVRPRRGSLAPGLRDGLRRAAGSGFVAQLVDGSRPALLDQVLQDAGTVLGSGLGVGADGAVRAMVTRNGRRALLRMGLAGSPADPSTAAAGLRLLAARHVAGTPTLLADGCRSGVAWSLETALPGRRPDTVSAALTDQVAAFLAALPRTGEPVDPSSDAEVIATAAPSHAAGVHRIAATVADSPLCDRAQLRHGDLWSGNLLARGDVLTGVVDWDAWSSAGLPAVDLLHLLGTEERLRSRAALGAVWLRRPWDDPVFAELVGRHWPEWGGDAAARAAVGSAWWLGQLAADLRRNPGLAADRVWVERNIAAVVDASGR